METRQMIVQSMVLDAPDHCLCLEPQKLNLRCIAHSFERGDVAYSPGGGIAAGLLVPVALPGVEGLGSIGSASIATSMINNWRRYAASLTRPARQENGISVVLQCYFFSELRANAYSSGKTRPHATHLMAGGECLSTSLNHPCKIHQSCPDASLMSGVTGK